MKRTILALLALAFCGCQREPADGPPKIAYGRDECVHCGMIVSEERHAAALRAVIDGQVRDIAFDDIGDMLAWEREQTPAVEVKRRFVHDFETRQWLDAASAYYVISETIHTPMGSGIIAFATEPAARAKLDAVKGNLLTFDQLRDWTTQSASAAGK